MAIQRNDTIAVPSRQRWHYARCVGINQDNSRHDCVAGIWEVCAAPDDDRGMTIELLFAKTHYSMMGGNQGTANTDIPNVLAACAPHILKQLLDLPGSIPVTESGGVKASEWLLKRLDNKHIFADLAPWLDGGKADYVRLCREDALRILLRKYDEEGVSQLSWDGIMVSHLKRRYYQEETVTTVVRTLLAEKKVTGTRGGGWIVPALADDIRTNLAAVEAAALRDWRGSHSARPELSYDAFLCHASEDKDTIVRPFADIMVQEGLKPWLDEGELRWGDNLVGKIQHGLSTSRYVIVFISQKFLGKHWPEIELNAALSLEPGGRSVVLPILCGVSEAELKQRYPLISAKIYKEVPGYSAAQAVAIESLEPLVCELRKLIESDLPASA